MRNVITAVVVALLLASASTAQPVGEMEDLGTLGGLSSSAIATSADGSVVVGESRNASGKVRAFRWTAEGGMENLGTLGGDITLTRAVSADGLVVVGDAVADVFDRHAFRWTVDGGMEDLGTLGGRDSWVRGVSADGSVIVGYAENEAFKKRAFRWTAGGGMEDLGTLGGDHSAAFAVSADGSVIVGDSLDGSGFRQAVRWAAGGGPQSLGTLGADHAQAWAVSADGSVVVGDAQNAANEIRAFRWTAAGGMESLGTLGGVYSRVGAVSADGLVVVGEAQTAASETHAYSWTIGGGMEDLGTLGGIRSSARAVSADGSVVVGDAHIVDFEHHAFRWTAAGDMADLGTLGGTNSNAWAVSADGSVVVGEAYTGTGQEHAFRWSNADIDGDGLLDDWEINGVPWVDANDTVQRFMLPGANPYIKDLYVEVDAMSGWSLSNQSVILLEDAFEFAPLDNPDNPDGTGNLGGVTLHILKDEADLPHVAVWDTGGCWPLDFDNWRTNNYGTAAERADPDNIALLEAKAKAYRYCIVADTADNPDTPDDVEQVGGCGQRPGDNFVVFFGSVGATNGGTEDENRAAVFMHELGHNLGLEHGGGDADNGKPNYPSIMNYVLSYKYTWNAGFWEMDYSREDAGNFATLDESSLDENVGIGMSGGFYDNFAMPFGINEIDGGNTFRRHKYVTLNGHKIDYGDTAGTMFQDGNYDSGVEQDLNYVADGPGVPAGVPSEPSPDESLEPFDDWANVGLPLAAALGDGAPAPSYPTDELTEEAIAWIDENFPPPPGSCRADLNDDGVVDTLDFLAFLGAWSAGDLLADWNGDGVVNTLDFLAYLTDWVAGC